MNIGNSQRMNKQQLMEWIMMLGFCAIDMALYLDTHPCDTDALNYFNQCNELYQDARNSYEEMYGPLTIHGVNSESSWTWVEGPLPWEGVC